MQPEIQVLRGSRALGAAQNKVLRNTYLLLALTMIPTVVGALVGMQTSGIVLQHPIVASLVMLAGASVLIPFFWRPMTGQEWLLMGLIGAGEDAFVVGELAAG
jgi:FtsH-binding integral membrane protein